MSVNLNGIITKSIRGIYYVDVFDNISGTKNIACKARGVFRKEEISPVCADRVVVELNGSEGVITKILPRKSYIGRPPIANLDYLVFVNSTISPKPNLLILDKFIAVAVFKGITPVVVFTKTDLKSVGKLKEIYQSVGISVFCVDNLNKTGAEALKDMLQGKISAFTGNTGVGKSSLLNNMFPELNLQTNEISKKLGRGKHTTRHVELYPLEGGGYIADTPGFSSFDTARYDIIFKEQLADCFAEFAPFKDKCRFLDCSHTKEQGCKVIEAVNNGVIPKSRFESYLAMYDEAKLIKEWEHKK